MSEKKNGIAKYLIGGVLFILLLVVIFLLSYFCVGKMYSNYLNKKDEEKQTEEKEVAMQEAEENVANCGFTMVYLDDVNTEEVEICLLRAFNELSCEMSAFQIPRDSQITLSDEVIEEMSKHTEYTINKTLLLTELAGYFSERETKYEMINLAIQDLIGGVEISSYEALDYDSFIQLVDYAEPILYKMTQIVSYTDEYGSTVKLAPNNEYEVDGRMALGILTYDDGFGSGDSGRMDRSASYLMEFVTTMTKNYSETEMNDFLEFYYGLILNTGSKDNKADYLDDILNLTEENLSFYTMKGTQTEESYILDAEKIQADIQIIMGEEAYKLATGQIDEEGNEIDKEDVSEEVTTEAEDETVISSEDKSISVYNGAYIGGLAGRWSERLESEGYRIERIDNYTEETLENGKIIVKEEGWGKDLQEKYFPNAVIEVGTPEYGVDIQIILGRSEDF